ncbi:MAG: DEAD/DEAH box helicase [Treponema sp.]
MKTPQFILKFRFTPTLFAVDDAKYTGKFLDSPVQSLYDIGFENEPSYFDEAEKFLYKTADTFLTLLSKTEGIELLRDKVLVALDDDTVKDLLNSLPFAPGSEYVNFDWIKNLWQKLNECYSKEIKNYSGTVAIYLAEKSQHLKVAEKIFFHLVENHNDDNFPFSFLATYSTKTDDGSIKHVPLKYALTEYKSNRDKILELLSCLNQAGDVCPLINEFIEKGEMFHPLRLKSSEAYEILKSVFKIEETGIVCRIPDWWKKKKQNVSLSVKIGENKSSLLGLNSILSMDGYLEADGQELTAAEIKKLLTQTDGLAFIKGKWIEVNHEKLNKLLLEMEKYHGDIAMIDALRMNLKSSSDENENNKEPVVTNGAWLSEILNSLRSPVEKSENVLPQSFKATLRPYQTKGFSWLNKMEQYGFGSCLADDMGLGKTVQVLAYLESVRAVSPEEKILLVVPASLLGNWQNECKKFTPLMPVEILHSSIKSTSTKNKKHFLYITTYSMVSKNETVINTDWNTIILDEAQAIKNPLAKQTKNIKLLNCKNRIALTGTPIENDLSNLWSIFDFLDKGLLGSSNEFKKYCKTLQDNPQGYSKLKAMISPFMLRRLKTDKTIISDLPEKLEMVDYVTLSKKQRVLYKKYVDELSKQLEKTKLEDDPMKRRGLVLASLSKLKQICNHPDEYTGEELYAESDSGKFEMLRSLCETIYEKRERVLVFTQFKEITTALSKFLSGIFGAEGFVLHGGTSIAKRNKMVEEFQSDKYIPYMVISVKAGGTGLNLTNANHVIHFDRWWNPAVENQATDRAFRIGQTKNVMVHKLVCRGTIEAKIDELIESKKTLAQNVIGAESGESWITEMNNDQLMKLLTLEEQ